MTGPETGGPPSGPKGDATGLVRIPFHDSEIWAVAEEGEPWIIFRHVVESIGLDYSSQLAKIRGRAWVNRRDITTVAADGSVREMTAVDVPTFLAWLAGVNEARVAESIRATLIAYQAESVRAIHDYWVKGVAVNPRSTMHAPKLLSLEEAAAVMRQVHGLDYTVVDLTRAMRSAGIIRLSGGPKKAHFNLLWWNGSAWHVVAEFLDILAGRLKQHESAVGLQLDHGVQLRMELDATDHRAVAA